MSDLRLVIVCDMWLTGFDCPPLHTMYLDRPLAGHSLMQAIARVNRVYGDKPGGLVVDLLGLAENDSARKAMENDKLRLMERELAEMVKRLPRLDWAQRESVRADLRRQVRRLLARYGYPPDLSEDATQLVLKQAELSTANGEP